MGNAKLLAALDKIKALCDAATEGPWTETSVEYGDDAAKLFGDIPTVRMQGACEAPVVSLGASQSECEATQEFIADSRTLVPKMERLIRAQARVIEALERWEIAKGKQIPGLQELKEVNAATSALTQAEKEFVEGGKS